MHSFSQDDEELAKVCKCSAEKCREPARNETAGAEVQVAEVEGQLTMEEIGNETFEDPILCQLREEVLQGRTGDVERSLIKMKSPRIGIKHSEQGSGPVHAHNIKPIHLSVVDGALMVNNRAWIPDTLLGTTMWALHTKSHRCSSRMVRKAIQSVYFIGMREILDEFVKGCMNCVDSRPMKPRLSQVPTERANYPFEVITMDFAEFTKSRESFVERPYGSKVKSIINTSWRLY